MFSLYKKSAQRRSLDFDLTIEDFINIIQKPCVYCGEQPSEDSGRNGIDRIDNILGYIKGNLTPCCIKCNQMKGKRTVIDFLQHIKKIYLFQENNYGSK